MEGFRSLQKCSGLKKKPLFCLSKGASKKLAKQACARAALSKLYNMTFTPHMQSLAGSLNRAGEQQPTPGGDNAGAIHGDPASGLGVELVPGRVCVLGYFIALK